MELALVFATGALVTAGLAALIRWWVTVLLERRGRLLDRWRRSWFHPEREVGFFLEALLIVSFLATFTRSYGLPTWGALALFVVWALHLPVDFWTWARVRLRPEATFALHQRGFFLLARGPLWLRAAGGLLAAGSYLLVPPLRVVFDFPMGFLVASLQAFFS
jgi:hypothetical protein